ncbi:MFS transporter [Thioclava sp. BHET1]|nr:MFS transporter [Thioclava sp. BHET1]
MPASTTAAQPARATMSPLLTLLFAIAGGIAVGNLYWSQPLLAVIAEDFGVTETSAGILVTVTQLGYATGILLIVPLGDTLNRRKLIPGAIFLSAVALVGAALSPSYPLLMAALLALGLATTAGQMITPLVGELAAPEQRGRVIGTLVSGMLSGILLSRALSGLIADVLGWRGVFAVAALAAVVMAACMRRGIPEEPARPGVPYGHLLWSIYDSVRTHAVVRATLLLGACVFAVFSMFWTALTFLLSSAPYNYSLAQIGLVGLAGLASAAAAKTAGRLHDGGLSLKAQGVALVFTLGSLVLAGLGAHSIVVTLIAVVALDGAIQTVNVLNQLRLLNVDEERRSRINSAFVTSNFIGGAIGSVLVGAVWPVAGWLGVMAVAAALIGIACLVWNARSRCFEASAGWALRRNDGSLIP